MSLFVRAGRVAIVILLIAVHAVAQPKGVKTKEHELLATRNFWIDSIYKRLTLEERIGQLFMVPAYSGGKNYNEEQITKLINETHVGGIIFMQGNAPHQGALTNKYQHLSRTPLLIAMDAEWGLGMRLDTVRNFPRQMMLGATNDTMLAYNLGQTIAAQCRRLGVHMDFAPDVDVNNNVANPVINSRSFGEDKVKVARMGLAYARGLQKHGVIACAKHFPGHGDTNVDSHADLPLISAPLSHLDSLEFYPFKQLIAGGVKSVMIAHLEVPALETAPRVPTSLSRNTITGTLKGKLGFSGLVITDAMNMTGLTKYFGGGEAELSAFAAGNDMILMSPDVSVAMTRLKNALDSGRIPMDALELSVKKILGAKFDAGLASFTDIDTANITNDLNKYVDPLRLQIARSAITIVKDDNQLLRKLNNNMRVAYIGVNAKEKTTLYKKLQDEFVVVKDHWLPKGSSVDSANKILECLPKYDATIIAVHGVNFGPANKYGLSDDAINFIQQAGSKPNVMVVLLGNAYAMQYFCGASSVMVGYEDDSLVEVAASEVLLKKIKAKGKLPVTPCANGGVASPAAIVKIPPPAVKEVSADLKNTLYPVDAGVANMAAISKLDMFIARDIADNVFPGCRILAAKDGKVFYDKAFGYMTYEKKQKVDTNTLYDMASCTKVLATTISVMRLYEQGKLDLDKTLGDYLPAAKGTNKANLRVRDILLHQAGLKGWIPFYKEVDEADGKMKRELYRPVAEKGFTVPVARNIFLRDDYIDTMWSRIYASGLDNAGKMVYSDLDFYFMAAVVKSISGRNIDKYVEDEFYKPLGLKNILYNPLSRFDTSRIAPTELETSFRAQELRGYVHDPGAALFGGVAGHAGIFATAHDVAVIFQMLMNKGAYGGKRYFKPATVDLFTAYNSSISHRGLGFDKPTPEEDNGGPAGDRCSAQAFGHQGFTGTCVWADPATGIVFVFLSNRVNPGTINTKINKLNVRTVAQDLIYESFGIPVNHDRPAVYKEQVAGK